MVAVGTDGVGRLDVSLGVEGPDGKSNADGSGTVVEAKVETGRVVEVAVAAEVEALDGGPDTIGGESVVEAEAEAEVEAPNERLGVD